MKKVRFVFLVIIAAIASNNSIAANYFENILKTIVEIEKNKGSSQKNQSIENSDKPYWYIRYIKYENSIGVSIDEIEKYIESISKEVPFEKDSEAKIKDILIGDNFTLRSNPQIFTLGKITYNNEPTECWADYDKLKIDTLYATTIACNVDVFGKKRGVEISGVRIPPFETLNYTVFSAKVGGVKVSEANIEDALIERMGKPEVTNFFDYRRPVDRCRASTYGKHYDFKKNPIDNKKINDCLEKLKLLRNAGGFFGAYSAILENGVEKTMKFRKNGTVFELSIYAKTNKEVGAFLESLMTEDSTQSISVYTDKSLSTVTQMGDSAANFLTTQAHEKIKQNKNDF